MLIRRKLKKLLESICTEGSPKQGKFAALALMKLSSAQAVAALANRFAERLSLESETISTTVKVLGCIAKAQPEALQPHLPTVVSFVFDELLTVCFLPSCPQPALS
jgi:hypothetical protein